MRWMKPSSPWLPYISNNKAPCERKKRANWNDAYVPLTPLYRLPVCILLYSVNNMRRHFMQQRRLSPGVSERVKRCFSHVRITALLLLVVSVIGLLAVACSNTETTPATTAAVPTSIQTTYPLTITDILGRTVTLNQNPSRIVTVHPTATETLYRVGGTAVGRDTGSKYPPEAQSLPTIGGSYNPSAESVAALNPDLIILEALSQGMLLPTFEKLGVPIITVRAASLDDIKQGLTIVARVIDMNEAATQAVTEIESRSQ